MFVAASATLEALDRDPNIVEIPLDGDIAYLTAEDVEACLAYAANGAQPSECDKFLRLYLDPGIFFVSAQ